MLKRIISAVLCLSLFCGSVYASAVYAEASDADIQMQTIRADDFEEYIPGAICDGSKAYPLDGEQAGNGVLTPDGGSFKQLRENGAGGFALSLNDGLEGNLVKTEGKDGTQSNALQILRKKGAQVSTAKLLLNPLTGVKTSHLTYSVDIRNGGKSGENENDAGYTRKVNNFFGQLSLLGFTLDFNEKSLIFGASNSAKPPISEKRIARVLPENGEWFNLRVEIDALEDKITVYINGKAAGERIYGGAFSEIKGTDLGISLSGSMFDENAIYFDNIKIEKSSITADELERIYNKDAFEGLGNALICYPGSNKAYLYDSVRYFSAPPFNKEELIYIPLRDTALWYGYDVKWNSGDDIRVSKGENEDLLAIGGSVMTVDGNDTPCSPVLLSSGLTYVEINDMAKILGRSAYSTETGLAMLLEGDTVPSEESADKIIALYPEASLGFEVEGGWYTEADLLAAAGVDDVEALGLTFGVNGRIKNESYETLRNGIKRSSEHVKSGKYSGKWDRHNYYPTAMTTAVPSDWSGYNALSFWLYSEAATGEHITVGAVSNPYDSYSEYSQNEYTTNFLYSEIYIDFTGWKQFVIPLDEFSPSTEKTVGFSKVDGLYFYTRAFDYEPYPQTVLYIDDVRLEALTQDAIAAASDVYEKPILEKEAQKSAPKDYVLDVPDIFHDVSLVDYDYILKYKKEIANGETGAQSKLDEIYKKYGITGDTYQYSDLVVQGNLEVSPNEELSLDKVNFNHKFPEVVTQPKNGRLDMQGYFKEARAITGYNPRFLPGATNTWGDFKFIWYASHAIEYPDYEGNWHVYDYSMQIDRFAKNELKLETYRVRTGGFYDETKMRFDNDGDAYATIMIQGTTTDGDSIIKGVLCYSRDKMKTWDFYVLPRAFTKMEILDGHNKDCLNGPPVIMLHNYWSNNDVQNGSFVIPEKQADGTLVIPEETVYCDEPVICTSQHSGKGNFCQTLGDKVYIVYGTANSAAEDRSAEALKKVEERVPKGHQMWDLLKGELSKYMVTTVGVPTYIIEYDKKTKKFSEPVFLATAGSEAWDAHNWASISLDSENHINVFIIGHHFPLLYTRSKNAGDISQWEPLEVISSGISYASMNIDSKDTIYAVTRNSNDGYTFDLCLQKKEKGGQWEETRIVKYWKQYYMVWGDDIYMDPETDDLYLYFRSKTNWTELFADEWAAKDFIFPEQSLISTFYPIGTNHLPGSRYANTGSSIRGEHTGMISHDGGKTWQMTTTEDYMAKRK